MEAIAKSSAVSSAVDTATVLSPPPGTGYDGPVASVRASPDAAALDAEQEPLLKETGLMGFSHLAAGMPAAAAETESGTCNDPISQPDMAPSIAASAEHADQAKKADAAEEFEPAQSSLNLGMQPLLMGWQPAAHQPAAASKFDHVPHAALSEESDDQHQKSTQHSGQRESEASSPQAVQNMQDLTTERGPESQKHQAPELKTSASQMLSPSHADSNAAVLEASLVPSKPLPGQPEQLRDSVQHKPSTKHEEYRAASALNQPASAALNTDTEAAGLAAEQFHLQSGLDSEQADMGMPKQPEAIAASQQTDQQVSWNMTIAASAALASKDSTEANPEDMSWSAPPRKSDGPGRAFPLLDWALADNKVIATPSSHAGHHVCVCGTRLVALLNAMSSGSFDEAPAGKQAMSSCLRSTNDHYNGARSVLKALPQPQDAPHVPD